MVRVTGVEPAALFIFDKCFISYVAACGGDEVHHRSSLKMSHWDIFLTVGFKSPLRFSYSKYKNEVP